MGRVTHYDTVQTMVYLLSQNENVAKYWVTVTAGQTHTINSLGIAAGKSAVVTWGDGLSNEYTGTATRTHVYASAGAYAVKIYTPENVLTFDLRDTKVSVLDSADLKMMVNVSAFYLHTLTNASITLNSADWVDWRPSTFQLYNLPSTSITLNSADWVDWRVSGNFYLVNLPDATITLNSADWVDWRVSGNFTLQNLPSATITIAPSTIKNWSTATTIDLRTGNLTQPQCDLVLWECYQIARTATNGTIRLNFTGNAAPSGTFQPCQSPLVSSSTPGKEIAYELLNDSLGVGFNKWTTVSTN